MEANRTAAARVAIIVTSCNRREDTLECLSSLAGLTYSNHFILLADQASSDGTPEAVRAEFPGVTVLQNPVNDGFTGGANRGIRASLAGDADYVLLLNNDTIVARDILEELVAAAEADPAIGAIGPLMLCYEEPEVVWSAGGQVGPRGESIMVGAGRSGAEFGETPFAAQFVAGCGLLARRQMLEEIGLLDQQFFIYYEETDLCARASRAGWKILTAPGALLWHKVSGTTGTASLFTLYYMRRNVLLYLERNAAHPLFARLAATADSLRLILVWLLRDRDWPRAYALMCAVLDYWVGRRGRSHRPFA